MVDKLDYLENKMELKREKQLQLQDSWWETGVALVSLYLDINSSLVLSD